MSIENVSKVDTDYQEESSLFRKQVPLKDNQIQKESPKEKEESIVEIVKENDFENI